MFPLSYEVRVKLMAIDIGLDQDGYIHFWTKRFLLPNSPLKTPEFNSPHPLDIPRPSEEGGATRLKGMTPLSQERVAGG